MLAERDAKIEQMTAQLKSSNGPSAQPSMPNQDSTGKESGGSEEDGRPQPSPAFDGMSDLKLEFQGQIMKLQQYIEANNLRHVDPLGTRGAPGGRGGADATLSTACGQVATHAIFSVL